MDAADAIAGEDFAGDFDDYIDDPEPTDEQAFEDELADTDESEDEEDFTEAADGEDQEDLGDGSLAGRATSRSAIYVVPPEDHITPDSLSSYEVGNILAVRTAQIEKDNNVFLPPGVSRISHDPVRLAAQELKAGMCPLIIQRTRSHGGALVVEERAVRHLQLLPTSLPI